MLLWIKIFGILVFVWAVFIIKNINRQDLGIPLAPIPKQQVEQINTAYLGI